MYVKIVSLSFSAAGNSNAYDTNQPITNERPRGKTNNVVSEQVLHKTTCTVAEKR